jgi:hypothetical protein
MRTFYVGHVAHMGKKRHSYTVWWEKLEERDQLEDLEVGRNNKVDLKQKGRGGDCICFVQGRDRWRAAVNVEIKFPFS